MYTFEFDTGTLGVVNAYGFVVDLNDVGVYLDTPVFLPCEETWLPLSSALHLGPPELRVGGEALFVKYLAHADTNVAFVYGGDSERVELSDASVVRHEQARLLDRVSANTAEFVSFLFTDATPV